MTVATRRGLAAVVLLEQPKEIELRQREFRQAQTFFLGATRWLSTARRWCRSRLASFDLLFTAGRNFRLAAGRRLFAAISRLNLSRNSNDDRCRQQETKDATHEMSSLNRMNQRVAALAMTAANSNSPQTAGEPPTFSQKTRLAHHGSKVTPSNTRSTICTKWEDFAADEPPSWADLF